MYSPDQLAISSKYDQPSTPRVLLGIQFQPAITQAVRDQGFPRIWGADVQYVDPGLSYAHSRPRHQTQKDAEACSLRAQILITDM
jgi:hypothetical protein